MEKTTNKDMYTFEEAVERFIAAGLGRQVRSDDLSEHYRRFGDHGSSLWVHRKEYALFATIRDFVNLKMAVKDAGHKFVLIENNRDKADIKRQVKEIETNDPEAIVLISKGNIILHNPSESDLIHKVVFYTKESFDFVVKILAKNEENLAYY